MSLFCQAGEISVPREYQQVLAYIEDRVFEVTPPDPARIFHPKVWVLRFAAPDEPPTYRLLVLSRNLTLDRSWDTVLRLDGRPTGRPKARNRPLADFVRALPGLSVRPVPGPDREAVEELADDLRRVDFELPDEIQDVAFRPLGLPGYASFPIDEATRLLVVSPFLTAGTVTRLGRMGSKNVLVSRAESLDAIGRAGLEGFEETYVLSPLTEDREDEPPAAPLDEGVAERPEFDLAGLHAKLFVTEFDRDARIWTGSANATDAAFNGNVEFLVELEGTIYGAGMRTMMTPGERESPTFRDLLEPHTPENEGPLDESDGEGLERRLDEARRALAACAFEARVEPADEDTYTVELRTDALPADVLEGVEARCWPAAVSSRAEPVEPGRPWTLDFEVSFGGLSSFFAFELVARKGKTKRDVRFAVNATLIGAPEDRRERILASILSDRGKVLRYLLFLLSDGGPDDEGLEAVGHLLTIEGTGRWDWGTLELPLFETMVRALARDPSRLDHIDRLVRDLEASGHAEDRLPERFREIWDPIWSAREVKVR